MMDRLEKMQGKLDEMNKDLVQQIIDNKIDASDMEWLDASIEETLFKLQELKVTIEAGKRFQERRA